MRRVVVLLGLIGCGQHPPAEVPDPPSTPIHIVATERGPEGGILVVIGESGDRLGSLVASAGATRIRDTAPAFSPDGAWIVFASSRGRTIDRTSLWAVPSSYDATPVRLTDSDAIDVTPVWTSAGDAIVFSSSRGGSYDLWRLAVEVHAGQLRPRGAPEQLTTAPGDELSPTVAPDGRIAYASLTAGDDGATRSVIEVRTAAGSIETLEPGPADSTPRFDPEGKRLAFTRPTVRSGDTRVGTDDPSRPFTAVDSDLWLHAGDDTHRVVDLPFTDESGPVWSIDGRWLFATSLVRKTTGEPLLSSVIHVDLLEPTPVARMLVDRAGAVTRLTPAVAPVVLDAAALRQDPAYVEELRRILTDAIERNEERAEPGRHDSPR